MLAHAWNKLNRLVIVPLVFREYPVEKITYLQQNSVRPIDFIFESVKCYDDLPPKIANAFRDFNGFEQKEFVARVDNCIIEPKYGWPMTQRRELIYDCFPYSRQHIIPTPPVFSARNQKVREVDAVISFREIFEFGYWHFYTDIINKNYLLRDFPEIDKNIPILISKELSERPHFKFFYEHTTVFFERQIIIQDNFLVKARRAYFIKPRPHKPKYYKEVAEIVSSWKGDTARSRRVFLTRSKTRGRFIGNMDALAPLLKKYNFELIDADVLSIDQQIRLFSETQFLIGIHGAGLTNMMFRYPATMGVLEILPDAVGRFQIPPHYFLLAGIFGFSYHAVLGGSYTSNVNKSFGVDPAALEPAIQSLLNTTPGKESPSV